MSLLVDHQIAKRQRSSQPLAEDPLAEDGPADDFQKADSNIQAASLDLTIGEIYIPGTDKEKPGGADTPLKEISLKQGHTAVIRTKEVLHLGSDLAGIAFPPASISLKGLLMTNPGHIDPGYRGYLHLTVINMSHDLFSLRAGDRIMRVLFISLEPKSEIPYDVRHPGPELPKPITSELLGRLSVDFVDVKNRAKKIAKGAVKMAQIWAITIPVVVAVLSLAGLYLTETLSVKEDVQKVSERVTVVETKYDQQALDERIKKLEDVVAKLKPATPAKQ